MRKMTDDLLDAMDPSTERISKLNSSLQENDTVKKLDAPCLA